MPELVHARATRENVVARVAVQDVVTAIADDRVVSGRSQANSCRSDEVERLDVQRHLIGVDIGIDGVVAFACRLVDEIPDLGDLVGVVAARADHDVVPGPADQNVVLRIADDHVVQGVTGCVQGSSDQTQVLDIGPQCIGDIAEDGVVAFTGRLNHHISGLCDLIGVITGPAIHRVVARPAEQDIVERVAHQYVVEPVAEPRRGRSDKTERLRVRGQRIAAGI